MTNKDDIVIPRSELPETIGSIEIHGTRISLADGSNRWIVSDIAARTTRKQALNYLALAEAIDGALAEEVKKAEKDKILAASRDHLKLISEASRLCFAGTGSNIFTSSAITPANYEHWISIARAARELHGK